MLVMLTIRLRFELVSKSTICVKTKPVPLENLRAVNLASWLPFEVLENSPMLKKVWRVGYYESKEYGPIKPLFGFKHTVNLGPSGSALRIV